MIGLLLAKRLTGLACVIFLLLFCPSLYAQEEPPEDSVQVDTDDEILTAEQLEELRDSLLVDPNAIYYTRGILGTTRYNIDTSVHRFQYYDPGEVSGFTHRNVGNLGTALIPVVYQPDSRIGFRYGFNQYDLYRYDRDNIPFFHSNGPYSNLQFLFGLQREQMVRVDHNQNFGDRVTMGFHFNRYASDGFYLEQVTRHNNVVLTSRFQSKNGRYRLKGLAILNNINNDDNGGIEDTTIFDAGPVPREAQIATELSRAETKWNEQRFILRQSWGFGKEEKEQVNDSTTITNFFPAVTFFHDLDVSFNRYTALDDGPSEDYLDQYYLDEDTVQNTHKFHQYTNQLGIAFSSIKKIQDHKAVYHNWQLGINGKYTFGRLEQQDTVVRYVNEIILEARFGNHPSQVKGLKYEASGAISFIDYNQGDLRLGGKLGYNFGKAGQIDAGAFFSRHEAPYIYQRWFLRSGDLIENFDKINLLSINAQYHSEAWGLNISGNGYVVNNLIYWSDSIIPLQETDAVVAFVLEASKTFRFWRMGWDPMIRLQFFSGPDILRFPTFTGRQSLFYQSSAFNNAIELQVGIDMHYNTNYFADGYFPLNGQFYIQDTQELQFYPVFDVYLNFRVKTAQFFLKLTHLNEGWMSQKGYFSAFKYPLPGRSFRLGLSWKFFN